MKVVPDRTGQTWKDGAVVFTVVGPPAFTRGISYHPVVILDVAEVAKRFWTPGSTDEWPEEQHDFAAWEQQFERLA